MAEAQVGFRPDCEADPRLALSRRTNQDGAWAVLRGNDTNGSNPARGDAKRKAAVTERRRGFRPSLRGSLTRWISPSAFILAFANSIFAGLPPILSPRDQDRF
ncbi:MAG: hypothetical protein QOH31_6192 [Verrucomicrobiota bacterium]